MQDPPQEIRNYLLTLAIESRSPAWMLVNRQGQVADFGGDIERYPFGPLQVGQPAVDHAEFLIGMLPLNDKPVAMMDVAQNALCSDVHLIPGSDGDWVLLLDATQEIDRRRVLKQKTNDLALLQERETKVVAQLRAERERSAVFDDLLHALGTLVLESSGTGTFHVIAAAPDWYNAFAPLSGVRSDVTPVKLFPFLEVFLPDAELAWADGTIRRSDVWTEVDPGGTECHLVATAMKCGSRKILLIGRSETDFHEKQSILQFARESRLRFDRETTIAKRERDTLAQASRAKSRFLADMGHELRSPLSAILSFSELLQEQSEAAGDQKSVKDLQRIRTAGEHLLSVINEVLDLSKAEAGMAALHVDEFSVIKLAQDVRDMSAQLVAKNGNTIRLDYPRDARIMRTDMVKLRQSLLNLVANASKFTRNGSITVAINFRSQGAVDFVDIAVRDTGIGMTQVQIDRLFKPFSQADASIERTYGGSGLGLAISRQYCRLMGGDLFVESQPGAGSTFTIHVPTDLGGKISS